MNAAWYGPWSLSLLTGLVSCTPPATEATDQRLGVVAEHAMVVCAHPLATAVGVEVMRAGGNAIDAAVATHFALAVVLPWAGNIGGGGLMVSRTADGRVYTLDFRETAPAAASRDMYLDSLGNVVPKSSLYGHLASAVPGSVAGLFALHDSLGHLPMDRLIQPAIDLATRGFPLTINEARELNTYRDRIKQYSTRPSAYTARDHWMPGDTLRLPELARTLMLIRDHGRDGFYTGATADLLVGEMIRGGGVISHADLAAYQPVWRDPVRGRYRGHEVIGMAPPSSGGIAVLQLLECMEPLSIHAGDRHSAALTHRMVEAERRVYADRAVHLGDADFTAVPVAGLLDSTYILSRMADVDPHRATRSERVRGGAPMTGSEHTTHLSVVDTEGNAVSLTTTLNSSFGSCVVVGGAGFLLNNEMDDFSIKPGTPNAYGLVGGEANAIAPGKRMLSSMSPTIVTRNNELYLVVGSPGGSTIITSVFQVLMDVIDHHLSMQEAVSLPRFHHQWLPDSVFCETGSFTREDSLTLVNMGHRLKLRPPIGRVDAIRVLPDGRSEGGADPRGDDTAAGF